MILKRSTLIFPILFLIYKIVFEFYFLPIYFDIFGYLIKTTYQFDVIKYLISTGIFGLFLTVFMTIKNNNIITAITTLFYSICIIPMLGVYAFYDRINEYNIILPAIFWLILLVAHIVFSKQAYNSQKIKSLILPKIRDLDNRLCILAALNTLLIWAWAGFPILFFLSGSTAQRLALREASMPTLMGYVFFICGGVIIPYLFARYAEKQYSKGMFLCFVLGYIMYSINGMKTWLFMYLIIWGFIKLIKKTKYNWYNVSFFIICGSVVVCFLAIISGKFGVIDYVSQVARILAVPNSIGFRSLSFFQDNELLYLRESILRLFFDTPYFGGSDFYMDYGTNSGVTSSRSNNGLWGDAYRNFGAIGILIYPVIIAKILSIVHYNSLNFDASLQFVISFMMIWNSINISFFTWLVSGGVFIILIILKMETGRYEKNDE